MWTPVEALQPDRLAAPEPIGEGGYHAFLSG